jgi:hypothetical protein
LRNAGRQSVWFRQSIQVEATPSAHLIITSATEIPAHINIEFIHKSLPRLGVVCSLSDGRKVIILLKEATQDGARHRDFLLAHVASVPARAATLLGEEPIQLLMKRLNVFAELIRLHY